MILTGLDKHGDIGLLILRIGMGAIMMYHGIPKILAGPQSWAHLGDAMASFGITFMPVFWGFMAAFAESVGGLMVLLGFLFRPFTALLVINMTVASVFHFTVIGDKLKGAIYPLTILVVFLSLFIIGPGKYSLDHLLTKKRASHQN
jgi:putative oxidoreductase